MNQPMTVLDMVHGLLADTDRMLQKHAEEAPAEKKEENPFAAKKEDGEEEPKKEEKKEEAKTAAAHQSMLKIAAACDFLADNLHKVVDNRTPTEKLAEHVAIQKALMHKMGGEPVPPTVPGGEVIPRFAADAPGESMDAGQSGEATSAHQPPKETAPGEHAVPTDAGNALPTNKEMMHPDQPEDVLKQSSIKTADKIGASVENKRWASGKVPKDNEKMASAITKHAQAGHIPPSFAKALVKTALEVSDVEANGENASISGGKEPVLQSAAGAGPAMSQGSVAGENTPRETAPTHGEGAGRGLIESNESAINYKKRDAKAPTIAALKEVLTEPAMSAAHDKTLHESLTNTSEAGVKIAATKALLKKIAESSPAGAELVAAVLKQAQEGMMPGAGPAAAAPPVQASAPVAGAQQGQGQADQGQMGQQGPGAGAPQQGGGVSPAEVQAAQQLLQSGGAGGGMPQGAAGVPAPGQSPAA